MLISLLPVPFAYAARQRQFEALEAVLQAEADASGTVLLGNLGAWAGLAADALLVQPAGLVVLVLVPRAGHLTMPALAYGGWQLSGQPLPGREGADNPFAQYQQQAAPALAWLTAELGLPAGQRPACRGLALFDGPLTFGPEVEAHLHQHAAARHFELLGNVAQVPAWLRRQLTAGPSTLDEDDLLDWADNLADTLAAHPLEPAAPAAPPAPHYLADKLRQLWRWLGAEDIPADPPYGGASLPDLAQRDQQEQARLHQLRQELQAELHQHRQEAAAREEARTQELAQLRQQLAQAGPSATARQTEQQAALEDALRTARAELAAQSQELDARIRQLGQLMQQLAAPANNLGAPASAPGTPTQGGSTQAVPRSGAGGLARPVPRAATRPARAAGPLLKRASYRPLRRAERWSVLLLALALVGGGVWGVVQLVKRPAGPARSAASHRARRTSQMREATQQPGPVIIYDTLAGRLTSPTTDAPDVTDDNPSAMPAASEAAPAEASPVLHVDSAKLKVEPAPLLPGDSATSEASPAP
jgi:hypothetical protein